MVRTRRDTEWYLKDWNWDGHLFLATPLNDSPSVCENTQIIHSSALQVRPNCSVSSSGDSEPETSDRGRREAENRRREREDETDDFSGSLTLNLGGLVYPVEESRESAGWDAKNGKRSKIQDGISVRVVCQVEGCGADLSEVKDYHRRHKVCEMHAKASKANVGSIQQRFCQQCSRFHLLEEFDDDKRSCRRRLAGHNRRRRKPRPYTAVNGIPSEDNRTSGYLLTSLLRILTNLHSGISEPIKDQELLTHLLKNLASLLGPVDQSDLNQTYKSTQVRQNPGTSAPTSEPVQQVNPLKQILPNMEGIKVRSFDLNDVCDDQESDHPCVPQSQWQDTSHPHPWAMKKSDNSNLTDSTFNGLVQKRTDRIVFKLFGKDPSDFPLSLRRQILDWLSNSPMDIEGYIRPGCLILTIYVHLKESSLSSCFSHSNQLCSSLTSNLEKLMIVADGDGFWKSGWVYSIIQHQIAFILNGRILLDTPILLDPHNHCEILSVYPLAVSEFEEVRFTVNGLNLTQSSRVLCAFDGKYLAQELTQSLHITKGESQQVQCFSFYCSIPKGIGRGVIEVEDHALRSSTFPFIVAEEAVSAEIRTLESIVNTHFEAQSSGSGSRKRALDFLYEMGWFLRKAHLRSNSVFYPLAQFKFLVDFSVDQNWLAVVKNLLDVLFSGAVAVECSSSSFELILSELSLLHSAVQKNRRSMVELLLTYVPGGESTCQHRLGFMFRPDTEGPLGVTPLHIAASRDDAEDVLDALTSDPGQVGVKAWTTSRDSSGFTPEDYAGLRGHESYIKLVHDKIRSEHAISIPPINELRLVTAAPTCRDCLAPRRRLGGRSGLVKLGHQPTVLLMVGIAAVCICVGLLLHSPPEVSSAMKPFRWEMMSSAYI